MKDKELREILESSDLIYTDNKGRLRRDDSYTSVNRPISTWGVNYTIRDKIHDQERQIQDQQEQIDFILKHLNIDIEKFEGYVKKELSKP